MSNQDPILVTGASGHLGQQVLENLLKGPQRTIIATTRDPQKLASFAQRGVIVRSADFDDPASLNAAFAGAHRVLLISTDKVGSRIQQHKNAIDAAKNAGVKHIIYTSLPNAENSPVTLAPEHAETEKHIKASGLGYTILRNNLYADLLLHSLPTAVKMGSLVGATGDGRAAYITRADCAKAAAAALVSNQTQNSITDLTGSEAISSAELASLTSELSGQKIPYVAVSTADFKAGLMKAGLPDMVAGLYASFDQAIREGSLQTVTNTFRLLTGEEPQKLSAFLLQNKAALSPKA